jgi:hypothetical protein
MIGAALGYVRAETSLELGGRGGNGALGLMFMRRRALIDP